MWVSLCAFINSLSRQEKWPVSQTDQALYVMVMPTAQCLAENIIYLDLP